MRQTEGKPDDFAMMQEALRLRLVQASAETSATPMPDDPRRRRQGRQRGCEC